jgi:hypothetical protein
MFGYQLDFTFNNLGRITQVALLVAMIAASGLAAVFRIHRRMTAAGT